MKTSVLCMECVSENKRNVNLSLVDIEEGIIKYVCKYGHENNIKIQNFKFELLFEMGIDALLNGYYREAVFNFASALERFHEFSIKLFCKIKDISVEDVNKTWKHISNQSERQLGAFYFLYLMIFNETPDRVRMVDLRNRVIHKGEIISKDQAVEYGQYIFEYINSLNVIYNDRFKSYISMLIFDHVKIKDTSKIQTTMAISTLISTSKTASEKTAFKEYIEFLIRHGHVGMGVM